MSEAQHWRPTAPIGGNGEGASVPASRRLLARWTSVMAAVVAGLLLVSVITPGAELARHAPASLAAAGLCLGLAGVAAVRGAGVTGACALLVALVVDAGVAYFAHLVDARPGGHALLLLLVWPTLLVANYLGRRYMAAQLAAAITAGVVVFHDLPVWVALLQSTVLASSLTVVAAAAWHLRAQLMTTLAQTCTEAATDPLTGLANRRGIDHRLPALWAAAARRGEDLEVLVVDVDRFKDVNDDHGHDVGDEVLTQLARILLATVRADDVVGRLGGEEFVVLAAVRPAAVPGAAGERVRHAVGSLSGPVPVTVSIGSTTITPEASSDAPTALAAALSVADAALYESKRNGRNRVTVTCRT